MWRVLAVASVAILSSGCGMAPGAAPGDSEGDVPPRDPDIVVSVYSTGVHGDPGTRVPDFQMRRDGTVFVNGDGPFGTDRYRLSGEGIDQVRDLMAGVSTSGETYGDVNWTDQGTTTIYLNLDGDPESVGIYALRTATSPDDLRADLRDHQVDARRDLLAVLASLDELGERAAGGEDPLVAEIRAPYTPEQIELTLLPAVPYTADQPAPIEWPLDRPLVERQLHWRNGQLCTIARGEEAAELAPLVERLGVQERLWSTGVAEGSPLPDAVQLNVHGFLPGEDGHCGAHGTPVELDEGGGGRQLSLGPFDPVMLVEPADWNGQLAADRFAPATPLEMYAATPILEGGMAEHRDDLERRDAPGWESVPTGSDLTWYEYRAIAAEVETDRYLDVEAYLPETWRSPGDAASWRARVDLIGKNLVAIEIDQ